MSGFKMPQGHTDSRVQQPTTQIPLKLSDKPSTEINQQQAWAAKTETNGFMRLNPYDMGLQKLKNFSTNHNSQNLSNQEPTNQNLHSLPTKKA